MVKEQIIDDKDGKRVDKSIKMVKDNKDGIKDDKDGKRVDKR